MNAIFKYITSLYDHPILCRTFIKKRAAIQHNHNLCMHARHRGAGALVLPTGVVLVGVVAQAADVRGLGGTRSSRPHNILLHLLLPRRCRVLPPRCSVVGQAQCSENKVQEQVERS